jgi:hypothetical protein
VVIISWPFPLDLASRCPNLKWVHSVNAGASNIRQPYTGGTTDFWGAPGLTLTTALAAIGGRVIQTPLSIFHQ